MTAFAPDPALLKVLWMMLAVDGQYLRVSWSPGAGRAPLELPAPVGDEQLMQRLVAEFDAEELHGRRAAAVLRGEEEEPAPELVSYDFAADDGPGDWVAMVARMCEDRDVLLSAGVRPRRGFGTCGQARVLWARVEGRKEARALERLRPPPTLIVREGGTCRMVALWSLRRPLSYEWLVRANRRIAHRLFGPKKFCDAEFAFPCPGSCLRVGRTRPVPIVVESFDPSAIYVPRQVVGHLKDAPSPDAWREKAAA